MCRIRSDPASGNLLLMRHAALVLSVSTALLGLVAVGIAAAEPPAPLYDESKVPAYVLPDPLVLSDGTPVRTPDDWWRRRRPEIVRLFEENVYGKAPAAPTSLRWGILDRDAHALSGLATRTQIRVLLEGTEAGAVFTMLVYRPNAAKGPVPTVLALNFEGNQAVHSDPGIQVTSSWVEKGEGVVGNRATEATRGRDASAWPVERILDRGYALATVYYGEIEPDHPTGWRDGVRSRFGPGRSGEIGPGDWGALAAWAWGLQRAQDVIAQQPELDGRRVAVLGHSRLGKAALWAAALDTRFALALSNESGEGGAALARRRFGETTEAITRVFPHWFAPRFREYAEREDALPVDQHLLLALVAPRPLYVGSAADDAWADPRGEFLATVAASPAYRLLGRQGMTLDSWPALERSVGETIGYHVRRGPHALTAHDWELYLDFADRHLGGSGSDSSVRPGPRRTPGDAR